jgi:hypothetical protein
MATVFFDAVARGSYWLALIAAGTISGAELKLVLIVLGDCLDDIARQTARGSIIAVGASSCIPPDQAAVPAGGTGRCHCPWYYQLSGNQQSPSSSLDVLFRVDVQEVILRKTLKGWATAIAIVLLFQRNYL